MDTHIFQAKSGTLCVQVKELADCYVAQLTSSGHLINNDALSEWCFSLYDAYRDKPKPLIIISPKTNRPTFALVKGRFINIQYAQLAPLT